MYDKSTISKQILSVLCYNSYEGLLSKNLSILAHWVEGPECSYFEDIFKLELLLHM